MGKIIYNNQSYAGMINCAGAVMYDGTASGLEATNLQDAVDQVSGALNGMRFGVNENGEYGYYVTDSEGADTFVPFKSSSMKLLWAGNDFTSLDVDLSSYDYIAIEYIGYYNASYQTTNSKIQMFPIPFTQTASRPYLHTAIVDFLMQGNGDWIYRTITITETNITLGDSYSANSTGYKVYVKKVYGISNTSSLVSGNKKYILNGSYGHENISLGFRPAAGYTVYNFNEVTDGYYSQLAGGSGQCGIYITEPVDLSKYNKIGMSGSHQGVPITLEYDCSADTETIYICFGGNCGNGFHQFGIWKKEVPGSSSAWGQALVTSNHTDWATNAIYGNCNIVSINSIWLE